MQHHDTRGLEGVGAHRGGSALLVVAPTMLGETASCICGGPAHTQRGDPPASAAAGATTIHRRGNLQVCVSQTVFELICSASCGGVLSERQSCDEYFQAAS